MARYTAQDFLKHVSQTAAQAAATVNAHTDKVAGEVSTHVTKTAATTAAAVNAHTTKTVGDAIKAVNAHMDDTADKLAKHATKSAASAAASVNGRVDRAVDEINSHADDNNRTILQHLAAMNANAFVPLWYMLVSLLVSVAAGYFSYVKWLADMATSTTSEIKRDAMGNAIEAVTVTASMGYPKPVTILLAFAVGAMVLGLLIGVGASIFGRRRHNDT